MPDDSNYPEPDESAEPTEPATEAPGADAAKGDKPDVETSLLPSSFFGGEGKVGEKYEIEIVADHEGELEVKYAKKDKSSDRQQEMSDAMDMGFASKSKAE